MSAISGAELTEDCVMRSTSTGGIAPTHSATIVGSLDDPAADARRVPRIELFLPRHWTTARVRLDSQRRTATHAVLAAAGHGEPEAPASSRPQIPGGLSRREVDVLRLAARGLKTQEIADRLFISPKTADHYIQHIYNKIGVSTRAAASLWAMQDAVVR